MTFRALTAIALLAAASAMDFSFVEPGTTPVAVALQKLGKPSVDRTTVLLEGEVDPFPPSGPSAIREVRKRADKRVLVTARVLEFAVPGQTPALLVFRSDVLLYVVLPSPGPPADVARTLGETAVVTHAERTDGDVVRTVTYHRFPNHRHAVVESSGTFRMLVYAEGATLR